MEDREGENYQNNPRDQDGVGRMVKKLLPKVLANVSAGRFFPGAITKRDWGTKAVPPGYAK